MPCENQAISALLTQPMRICRQPSKALAAPARGEGGAKTGLAQLQALAMSGEGGVGAARVVVDPIVKAAFSVSMASLFQGALVVVTLGLIAVLFIPNIPLRKTHVHAEPVSEPGEGTDGVVEG